MGFIMQAKDSVTGGIYYWVAESPDWEGDEYPGPSLPVDIAISAYNIGVGSPVIPS